MSLFGPVVLRNSQQDCPYCGKNHDVISGQNAWFYCLRCGCPLPEPCVRISFTTRTIPKILHGRTYGTNIRNILADNPVTPDRS